MTNNENNNIYENLKAPDMEAQYKQDAENLLKMINSQMQYYFDSSLTNRVDVLELHQIIRKIEKFESNTYGISDLKKELIKDMHTLIQHFEKAVREEQKKYQEKYYALKEQVSSLNKEKNKLIFLILLFQWYLYPKYRRIEDKLTSLNIQLKSIEDSEKMHKRMQLNTEQLIKVSHGFREKYLNIKVPTNTESQE